MSEPIVIECFELIVSNFEDDELAVLNYSLEFWNIFCLREIPNSDDGTSSADS